MRIIIIPKKLRSVFCIVEKAMMKHPLFAVSMLFVAVQARAAGEPYTLTIENHAFSPQEIKVPAGQKLRLLVVNKDATPAAFESKPSSREKIIAGKSSVTILIGPLKPGRYPFVEEYHEKEAGAQGVIVFE
jgi:plastocyanin